ncbi:hypothetical protein Daus18300_014304 [Diaporthe australafricana]|uniref:T6SS Phospholipase effector Tle1-like catalytic domain-containing protein n=1 Tax=Diaporthe australafricana TaxID=127596 RepID=A0ABR3VVR3_9PEZI
MGNAKDNGTETAESQVDSVVEEQQGKTDPTKINNDSEGQDSKRTVNHKSDENEKRLFVCCDGTWENAASSTPSHSTNVALFVRCVGRLEPEAYETKSGRKDNVVQGGIGTKESIVAEETWAALTGAAK